MPDDADAHVTPWADASIVDGDQVRPSQADDPMGSTPPAAHNTAIWWQAAAVVGTDHLDRAVCHSGSRDEGTPSKRSGARPFHRYPFGGPQAPPTPKVAGPIATGARPVGVASIRPSSRAVKASQAPYAAVAKADPPPRMTVPQAPGSQKKSQISAASDPTSPWFGCSPRPAPVVENPTEAPRRGPAQKGGQKGARIRSKSRNALAQSSGWERSPPANHRRFNA